MKILMDLNLNGNLCRASPGSLSHTPCFTWTGYPSAGVGPPAQLGPGSGGYGAATNGAAAYGLTGVRDGAVPCKGQTWEDT